MRLPSILLLCILLASPARGAAEPVRLTVAVAPVAWLVDAVGGDLVSVQTLVRSGQDPHAFEPAPTQLAALQRADAYLALGLPFENAWLPRVRAANRALQVVQLSVANAGPRQDPHLWTDPRNMIALSRQVAEVLVRHRPAAAVDVETRRLALEARLVALDSELAERFAALPGRTFLVHHPAWGHLAARYGLVQLAVEHDGKAPGPRAMAALTARIQQLGIDTLFVEPQASEHLAHGLADSLRLRIVPLDPLAGDYPANLRRVALAIAEAVR